MEVFPNLEEGRVINTNGSLEQEPVLKEKDTCSFRCVRFENLKDGQVDITSLVHVELGANKKRQDWACTFENNLKKEEIEGIKLDKSMQSKRRNPSKILRQYLYFGNRREKEVRKWMARTKVSRL